MKKIIFIIAFVVMIAGAFFFYNSQKSIADDKDGKCNKTECPKYTDCKKQCDPNCDKKCDANCEKKCEKKCDQSQMNGEQKMDCQSKSGCDKSSNGVNKSGPCPYQNKKTQ